MKTIADRGRKILSRLFRVISVSAASLILQACYGMMPPDEPAMYGMPPPAYGMPPSTSISGKVSSNETGEPIPGIKVSIDEGTNYWDYTNKDGCFNFWGVPLKDEYKIILEDVDGPAQGGQFQGKTRTLKQSDTNAFILIDMDLVP